MKTMQLRKEFKKILDNTVVPAYIPEEEKARIYSEWDHFLSANRPSRLYRFRRFDILSLEAFCYDQVWATIGSKIHLLMV